MNIKSVFWLFAGNVERIDARVTDTEGRLHFFHI